MKYILTIATILILLLPATPTVLAKGAGIEWDRLNQEVMKLFPGSGALRGFPGSGALRGTRHSALRAVWHPTARGRVSSSSGRFIVS